MVWVPQRRERARPWAWPEPKGQHTTIAMMLTRSRAHSCVCVTRVETEIRGSARGATGYSCTDRSAPAVRGVSVQPVAVSVTTDV